MVFSKIEQDCVAYYDLLAEKSLNIINTSPVINRLSSDSLAQDIFVSNIEDVLKDIEEDSKNRTFVIDCEGITTVQKNIVEDRIPKIVEILESDKTIVLSNVSKILIDHDYYRALTRIYGDQYNAEGGFYSFLPLCNNYKCSEIVKPEKVFKDVFTKLMEEKYCKELKTDEEQKHTSTSVRLTSYIDIKEMAFKERKFVLYAIYKLAMKVKSHWIEEEKEKPILVCQSLGGSYIASVVSSLLDLDIYILDQVGPVNKLYRNLGAKIQTDTNYIIVSDMVCMGTEVKIAKSIIEYFGGKCIGNISLVRVKSIKPDKDTEEVFQISKSNHEKFNYNIYTAIS